MGQIKNIKLHIVTDIKIPKTTTTTTMSISPQLKSQVVACYRLLNRTCQKIFAGDVEAIYVSRLKIRAAFMANSQLTDPEEILEQIRMGEETAEYMKKTIVQAKYSPEKDAYQVKMTEDTHFDENPKIKPQHAVDLDDYKVPDKYK